MSYFDLILHSDSPHRPGFTGTLPLSSLKRGEKAARGLRGEYFKIRQ